jgi:hypothetical protein
MDDRTDEQKYDDLRRELDMGPPAPPEPEAEPYDPARHGVPEPPQHQGQPQYEPAAEPDPLEDPFGHVTHRLTGIEMQAVQQAQIDQGRNIRDFVGQLDQQAREETDYGGGSDSDDAIAFLMDKAREKIAHMFPDTPQVAALATKNYLPNPQALRNALFQQELQARIISALQNNQNPVHVAFLDAIRQGFRPKAGSTKSQRRHLQTCSDKEFERDWPDYEKGMRAADENWRRR